MIIPTCSSVSSLRFWTDEVSGSRDCEYLRVSNPRNKGVVNCGVDGYVVGGFGCFGVLVDSLIVRYFGARDVNRSARFF